MKLLLDCTEFLVGWVKRRIPHMENGDFGPCYAIGVMHGDRVVAGVVYHCWQPQYRAIEISCAADTPKWATRRVLNELWSYPFEHLGVNRCTCATPADDARTRKFLEGIGMVYEGTGADAFGDHDAAVYRLLKREWQAGKFYLKEKEHGQKVRSESA